MWVIITRFLVAIKGLRLVNTTAHTLTLSWAPHGSHACVVENITVTAEPADQNHIFSCAVYKENPINFCTIKGLSPNKTYIVKALACTNTVFGCISTEGSISASTNPGKY